MDSAKTPIWACLLSIVVWPTFAAAGSPPELPGVGAGTITPETLAAFTTTTKMIQPPASLPQKWFSAQAEFIGTVATATASSVDVVEPMVGSEHADRSIRISGNSPAAGQIRQIVSNTSSGIEITPPFDVVPEAGDSVEVFTGDLPPGRWDGACTQADPCLDINQAFLSVALGSAWLWFDSGDVWDTEDEWCDLTNSPPGHCLDPSDPFRNRIMVQEYDDPALENEIRWGVSGTDLTGETFAVIDCDASLRYPPFGGGLFENQNGSAVPAMDHPTAWLVVQGMETRCWNRPAPGSFTLRNEWGEGTAIYKREYSGKLLAIHNRHGDLWDAARLVSGNGGNFTQGDQYQGGIILIDIEADTADYAQMVGQCSATNIPFRSCQGTDFTGEDRAFNGGDIRPRFITANGGGHILWIGGDRPHRNGIGGPYAGGLRHVISLGGFSDFFSNSGVGGSQVVTLVNLHLEGAPTDLAQPDIIKALPLPDRWGTTFEIRILNSRFADMPDGGAIVHFVPASAANQGTDTSLKMEWANVDVERYGSVFKKEHSLADGAEIDGGVDWTGRCLFIDGANPTIGTNRIMKISASIEDLSTRCMRHFIDLEGWIDGDDIPSQFHVCGQDASYASEAMAGTMMQPGNAGDVNGWEIFSQGNSGDWGGEGTDIMAREELATSPEVQNAVLDGCDHTQTYPLGQILPIGFISTADNLISSITLAGVRNLGFNPLLCTPPSEELYITTMDLNDTGSPVIHYTDPNQPAVVSGCNVYRGSTPTGPWTLVGVNSADMDDGTPGLQFIDLTGGVGGPWYYRIAAMDGICEGPW